MKSGFSIAFIGTDGSGKSTIISHIQPWLKECGISGVHYEHLRPNWLPPLGVATGKREKGDGAPVTDPHAQSASGLMGSLIRLAYYWIDYTIGYWVKIRPLTHQGGKVCIFDRYFYDISIDPRRMRIQLPSRFIRWAFIFAPRPDLVICLGGDPVELYARKPETSVEEVERQMRALQLFVKKESRAYWVDSTRSIENTVNEVKNHVTLCVRQ